MFMEKTPTSIKTYYFLVKYKPQNEENPSHILENVKLQFLQSVYFLQNAEYRIISTHFTVAKKDT